MIEGERKLIELIGNILLSSGFCAASTVVIIITFFWLPLFISALIYFVGRLIRAFWGFLPILTFVESCLIAIEILLSQ
jgi:hypothetical protein